MLIHPPGLTACDQLQEPAVLEPWGFHTMGNASPAPGCSQPCFALFSSFFGKYTQAFHTRHVNPVLQRLYNYLFFQQTSYFLHDIFCT